MLVCDLWKYKDFGLSSLKLPNVCNYASASHVRVSLSARSFVAVSAMTYFARKQSNAFLRFHQSFRYTYSL